jgi:hypothetical protein
LTVQQERATISAIAKYVSYFNFYMRCAWSEALPSTSANTDNLEILLHKPLPSDAAIPLASARCWDVPYVLSSKGGYAIRACYLR